MRESFSAFVLLVSLMVYAVLMADTIRVLWQRHRIPGLHDLRGWAEWSVVLMPLSLISLTAYVLIAMLGDEPVLALTGWAIAILVFRALAGAVHLVLTNAVRHQEEEERKQ